MNVIPEILTGTENSAIFFLGNPGRMIAKLIIFVEESINGILAC